VKTESSSPTPPTKKFDPATAYRDAEARLAEAEKLFKRATEPPRVAPATATRNTEIHPARAGTRPPAEPPHVGSTVTAKNMHPTETQTRPPIEPHVAPAAATNDIETHPAEPETQPPAEPRVDLAAMLKDMEARFAEAEKRAMEHHDAWLRAKAETENMHRRAQEEVAKASKFAAEKFAGAMLPVKDSLETALAVESQTAEHLREGVELTLKQLAAAFESANLTEENPLGQKFDPNKHQAIGVAESEAEPNTVINVLQKGYLLHGRVIRPAMVTVSKAKT